jgi:hypothetical protein
LGAAPCGGGLTEAPHRGRGSVRQVLETVSPLHRRGPNATERKKMREKNETFLLIRPAPNHCSSEHLLHLTPPGVGGVLGVLAYLKGGGGT